MRAVVMFHLRERHHVEQLVSQIARLAPTRDRRYYGAINRLPQDLVKDIMIEPMFALRTLFKTPFVTVVFHRLRTAQDHLEIGGVQRLVDLVQPPAARLDGAPIRRDEDVEHAEEVGVSAPSARGPARPPPRCD